MIYRTCQKMKSLILTKNLTKLMAVPFTEGNSNSHFTGLFKKLDENLYKKIAMIVPRLKEILHWIGVLHPSLRV